MIVAVVAITLVGLTVIVGIASGLVVHRAVISHFESVYIKKVEQKLNIINNLEVVVQADSKQTFNDYALGLIGDVVGSIINVIEFFIEHFIAPAFEFVSGINLQDSYIGKVYKRLPITVIVAFAVIIVLLSSVFFMFVPTAIASTAVDDYDSFPSAVSECFTNHDGKILYDKSDYFGVDDNYENRELIIREIPTSQGTLYLMYEQDSDGIFIPRIGIFEDATVLVFDKPGYAARVEKFGRVNDENGRPWITMTSSYPGPNGKVDYIILDEQVQSNRKNDINGGGTNNNDENNVQPINNNDNDNNELTKKEGSGSFGEGIIGEDNNGGSTVKYLLGFIVLVAAAIFTIFKKGKKGKDSKNSLEDGGQLLKVIENVRLNIDGVTDGGTIQTNQKLLLSILAKVRKGKAKIAGLGATSIPNKSEGKHIGWALAMFYRLIETEILKQLLIMVSRSEDKAIAAKAWLNAQGKTGAKYIKIMQSNKAIEESDIIAIGVPWQYMIDECLKIVKSGVKNKVIWVFGVAMDVRLDVKATVQSYININNKKQEIKIIEPIDAKNIVVYMLREMEGNFVLDTRENREKFQELIRSKGLLPENTKLKAVEIKIYLQPEEYLANHYTALRDVGFSEAQIKRMKKVKSLGEVAAIIFEGTGNTVVNAGNNVPAFEMGKEGILKYLVEVCTENFIAGQMISLVLKQLDENLQPVICSLSSCYDMESKTPWYSMYFILLNLNNRQYEKLIAVVEEIHNKRHPKDKITYDEAREAIKTVVNAKMEEDGGRREKSIAKEERSNDGGEEVSNGDLVKMFNDLKVENENERNQLREELGLQIKAVTDENQELQKRLGHVETATEIVSTFGELSRSVKDPIIEKILYCNLKKMIRSDGRRAVVKRYEDIVMAAQQSWIKLGVYKENDADLNKELLKKTNLLWFKTMDSAFNCFLDLFPRQLIADEAFKKAKKAGKVIERKTKSEFEAAIVELKAVIDAFNDVADFREISDRAFSYKMSLT
ncbi:MAG: hypothetical protein KAJ79_04025, partial [Candidatus Omnitrophica bacterium]|nr:hypothetical protein [Candidatus Omnitrophota bacterium]